MTELEREKTMLNIEKYKEDILKILDKEYSCGAMEMIYKFAEHKTSKPFKSYYALFNWLCEEYKEPLLTDDEKEFLQDLMKWYVFDEVYISNMNEIVLFKDESSENVKRYNIAIPSNFYFEKLQQFEGYTLEELDL
jgi:hypothetical protein